MLTQEIKRKIDSARDILVGKVPDPKAQVEQITIALIYKFMDDMDKSAEELGGKARFFTNDYEKYSWTKLMDSRLGGQDRLNLYVEAITHLSQNRHIPSLFCDIFKDAFVPYRNPETLNLFLKEVNGFSYDHSEDLGDAFEYLLSILGSQGEAGQFRTPRHIIDFIVEAVEPTKNDIICDPACGTAGFLISAYKYILRKNSSNFKSEKYIPSFSRHFGNANSVEIQPDGIYKGDKLTPDEKKKLMDHFTGYDISPDMVRISKVNMYLHNFSNPIVSEYDTLSSEEKWNEKFNIMLANPPFMTPKGGIKPHKRFSVQSNRAEVLFVDYILDHLKLGGRAGIIVPDGILDTITNAHIQLRKHLLENGIFAIISLPSGMFNPYATAKTSILLIDQNLSMKAAELLFIKISNDGYDLGPQRKQIKKNDLPLALSIIKQFKQSLIDSAPLKLTSEERSIVNFVSKNKITSAFNYNFLGEGYKKFSFDNEAIKNWKSIRLGELIEPSSKKVGSNQNIPIMSLTMKDGLVDQEVKFKKRIASIDISKYKKVLKNELVVGFPIDEGVIDFQTKHDEVAVSPAYGVWKLKTKKLPVIYLRYLLRSSYMIEIYKKNMRGTANRRRTISKDRFLNLTIPTPPDNTLVSIINKLEELQKLIVNAHLHVKDLEHKRDNVLLNYLMG